MGTQGNGHSQQQKVLGAAVAVAYDGYGRWAVAARVGGCWLGKLMGPAGFWKAADGGGCDGGAAAGGRCVCRVWTSGSLNGRRRTEPGAVFVAFGRPAWRRVMARFTRRSVWTRRASPEASRWRQGVSRRAGSVFLHGGLGAAMCSGRALHVSVVVGGVYIYVCGWAPSM